MYHAGQNSKDDSCYKKRMRESCEDAEKRAKNEKRNKKTRMFDCRQAVDYNPLTIDLIYSEISSAGQFGLQIPAEISSENTIGFPKATSGLLFSPLLGFIRTGTIVAPVSRASNPIPDLNGLRIPLLSISPSGKTIRFLELRKTMR